MVFIERSRDNAFWLILEHSDKEGTGRYQGLAKYLNFF
jgi:hypothetical protein